VIVEAVSIHLADVASREVYLKLSVEQAGLRDTVVVQRDGVTFQTLSPVATTTLIDTGLSPNSLHEYTAVLSSTHRPSHRGSSLSVRTLPPSSSNYTWHSYLLGEGAESDLSDVAIINDTLAYAVGEVYQTDSTGRLDPNLYNLAKWNGQSWQLMRVTLPFRGNLITPPIYGIYCFSPTDIWLAGGLVIHGDGNSWVPYDVRLITGRDSVGFATCWGSSSDDMFFAGQLGSLVRYAHGSWTLLQSWTTSPIHDLWGVNDGSTGAAPVFGAVYESWEHPGTNGILEIIGGTTVHALPWDPTKGANSVWSRQGTPLYASGNGVWKYCSGSWQEILSGLTGYMSAVRGNALNDIGVVDVSYTASHIYHFDGVNWEMFTPQTGLPEFGYVGLAMRGNLLMAVGSGAGSNGWKGLITIGRR
jgi:hypothetical protein